MPAMTAKSTDPRTIAVLVGSATVISLVGHVADLKGSAVTVLAQKNPALGDVQIILGGTAATVILVLLGSAGDIGATFAKGTAIVLLLSSIALYGKPVTTALAKVTGQASATTKVTPTPPTAATAAGK